MARKDLVRHQLFLLGETSDRLEALAGTSDTSKSSLLAEEDEVARAIGRDRFATFATHVGQQFAGGRRGLGAEDGR
jgi:hypothetical protein